MTASTLAQQDNLQGLAGQQAACSRQDTGIGALAKDDGLRLSLQFLLKIPRKWTYLITSSIYAAGLRSIYMGYYSTHFALCNKMCEMRRNLGNICAEKAFEAKIFHKANKMSS